MYIHPAIRLDVDRYAVVYYQRIYYVGSVFYDIYGQIYLYIDRLGRELYETEQLEY